MCLALGPQRSDAGEAWTHSLLVYMYLTDGIPEVKFQKGWS